MVEGARLLSEYTGLNWYRGFKSLSLRQFTRQDLPSWGLSARRAPMFHDFAPQAGLLLYEAVACAGLAQLDRATVYGTVGQRFESSSPRQNES